jgi:hypothetical protein
MERGLGSLVQTIEIAVHDFRNLLDQLGLADNGVAGLGSRRLPSITNIHADNLGDEATGSLAHFLRQSGSRRLVVRRGVTNTLLLRLREIGNLLFRDN